MKAPHAPRLDERRAPEFLAEMEERARAWIPSWGLTDGEHDFGRALLEISARFNSEVAERLDGAGEKMRRGLLDWLAVRGQAARPARMPVVFKLADTAREGVLASAPVRMQADAGGTPVVFETEKDVRIVPGQLDVVVGIDADKDAFYLPPPGLSDLKPLESLPTQWQVKSFAAAGVTHFQLDPEAGLLPKTIIEAGDQQYQIVKADKDLVTIDRPLVNALAEGSVVTKVTKFSPFDGRTYNQQQHALYLGDSELLNLEEAAAIEVVGAATLATDVTWEYWGKAEGIEEPDWLELALDTERQKTIKDAVALKKRKGAMELREIQGKNARWIRAYRKTVNASANPFTNDRVALRINSLGCPNGLPCPPPEPAPASPQADAMANTTPLQLNTSFFPLGKEPKQFDAFYLASKEAFSKAAGDVQLCFEMAEAQFAALSCLHVAPFPNKLLAGVGGDGFLHVFRFEPASGLTRYREPVRPPSPGASGAVVEGPPIGLEPNGGFRAPIWVAGALVFIAVTARNSIWVWREDTGDQAKSGWEAAGSIGAAEKPITGLVYLGGGPGGSKGRLFAVQDSKLYVRNLNVTNPVWVEVKRTQPGPNTLPEIKLQKIAPIGFRDGDLSSGNFFEGLVGVDNLGDLYGVDFVLSPLESRFAKLLSNVGSDVTPSAIRRRGVDNKLVVVAVSAALLNTDREFLGFLSAPGTFVMNKTDRVSLESQSIIGKSIDVNLNNNKLTFVTCTSLPGEASSLVAWSPFETPRHAPLFGTKIPTNLGTLGGAPTLLEKHVVVPTTSSNVLVAEFDLTGRLSRQVALSTGVITFPGGPQLQSGDRLAIPFLSGPLIKYQLETVPASGVQHEGQTLYEYSLSSTDAPLFVYPMSPLPLTARVNPTNANPPKLNKVKVDRNDSTTTDGTLLLITTDVPDTRLYEVASFDGTTRIAELDQNLVVADPNNPPATVAYRVPAPTSPHHLPLLRLDATSGDWNADLLTRTRLAFEGPAPKPDPELQTGTAFEIDASGHPVLVVLGSHWTIPPPLVAGKITFIVDSSVGEWSIQLGDTLSNPELSWEYWDGKAWSGLTKVDKTDNLKKSGPVSFKVPPDLASSDWAGKTNFWIRARLIGGDYGREKVTVEIKPIKGGTEQTVKRSTEGIRAPEVRTLHISYAVCKPVLPTHVLAEDSGTVRDQSDANRTPGAIVEAFVPLALTLGRLTKKAASAEVTKPDCPPDCDCKTLHSKKTETPVAEGTTSTDASPRITGREVYIGLDATPSEAPVNLLLLVEEKTHTQFAPMTIEALVADRFVPIVVDDATRALGESGVLSMSFAVPPTRSELFGKDNLTWLRLIPKSKATDEWIPTLRGAYLNAAWASATETLTRELLGSSDGAPNLTVFLARPPVLRDTLELRVKEPLGEEEREALLKVDANSVLSAVEGLPGDWVLWKQVTDPDDELATARVYALDEASGELRFGDGRRGKIPPIGRDSIVAFSYSRTEPDPTGGDRVPGNTIEARTALNLVSPVETVESVTAADQAAGGAPPESDERVLRFGFARLRHRSRAVTAEDLEDLALQSSPDIVQARAFVRRGYIRLVVVMRGKKPVPSAPQIRELRRLLLAAAPVWLSAPNALRIEGPRIRRLRIELVLLVEALDHAGELSAFVEEKLAEFFDTATGGIDKDGWALGDNPSEDDIALAISDAPYLDAIESVKLHEITEDGTEIPSLAASGPREIVMLADDPIRIQFETAEVMV